MALQTVWEIWFINADKCDKCFASFAHNREKIAQLKMERCIEPLF
jgi:hypothetical protein